MAKQSGPGIQSAAGLIRYFDAEEKSNIKIAPMAVFAFAGITAIGVILLRIFIKL